MGLSTATLMAFLEPKSSNENSRIEVRGTSI